jgi:polyhydroxyalkanoate synthase
LGRAVRYVLKRTGAPRLGVLGYCMGGTLSGIYTALNPDKVAALVNMLGPFDFSQAGLLGALVDKSHFDVETIAAAGNISAPQMQSGFVALRPTASIAKYLNLAFRPKDVDAFMALEGWASDNVPFPAAAYVTYIKELYQENLLVKGEHHVAGQRVDLAKINCPTLTLTADRDNICPPGAARGLHDRVSTKDKEILVIPGGHVGAVVGSKAKKELYPAAVRWLRGRLCSSIN